MTIMDIRQDAFLRLPSQFRGTTILGNGVDEGALRRAGLDRADVFIAVTQGDNRNLMAAQVAKHIFKAPRTIARVYDDSRATLFRELGLETLSSPKIVTGLIRDMIDSPQLDEQDGQ